MTDVLTFGETLVGFRAAGPLTLPGNLVAELRGAESNVAIGLARLGYDAAWVSRVSTDAYGELVLKAIRGEGVDVSRVIRDPRPTALMIVVQRTADVAVVEYRRAGSAASCLGPGDVVLDPVPRILHVTGITPGLAASVRALTFEVVELAAAAGATIVLDVNYRAGVWPRDEAAECLRGLLGHVDVLVASSDELDLVVDGPEDDAVAALIAGGVREVVVKRGAAGASAWDRSGRVDVAAVNVAAVDPIGAGDAFCVGYESGLLDGLPLADRLARAATVAAFAVSTHGDWAGLPTKAELSLLGGDTTRR